MDTLTYSALVVGSLGAPSVLIIDECQRWPMLAQKLMTFPSSQFVQILHSSDLISTLYIMLLFLL